ALADDLKRFLEGRPIQARPLSWGARLWRWSRRNPAAAAQVVAALTIAGMTLGSVLWLERQRAGQRAASGPRGGSGAGGGEGMLEQASAFLKQGRWPEARDALARAPSLLRPSAPEAFWARVRKATKDADMVAELEEIRRRLLEGKQSHEEIAPTGDRLYA